MPPIAEQIEAAGHTITHRWWEVEEPANSGYPSNTDNEELTDHALRDFIGVVQATAVILINSAKSEGKAVETGIALAGGKPVFLVGQRSNIFHYIPAVYPVATVEEALEHLK